MVRQSAARERWRERLSLREMEMEEQVRGSRNGGDIKWSEEKVKLEEKTGENGESGHRKKANKMGKQGLKIR